MKNNKEADTSNGSAGKGLLPPSLVTMINGKKKFKSVDYSVVCVQVEAQG